MIEYFEKYYRLLNRASSSLASPFLLAIRLYWGWQFMQTGWGKLTDIGKVIHFFTDLGIPAPVLNAYFVSALEIPGGGLLLPASGSARGSLHYPSSSTSLSSPILRRIARPCSPGHLRSRQVHRGPLPSRSWWASLVVLIFGAGWFSLDALVAGRRKERRIGPTGAEAPGSAVVA